MKTKTHLIQSRTGPGQSFQTKALKLRKCSKKDWKISSKNAILAEAIALELKQLSAGDNYRFIKCGYVNFFYIIV